jgi:flagellar hook assembly protein FlgD
MHRWRSSSVRTALDSNSSRLASKILVAALVLASVTALIVNQRGRAEGLVIEAVHIENDFAPAGGVDALAEISFRVKDADHVDVDIVDSGEAVERLTENKKVGAGEVVELSWDGNDENGALASPGTYVVRIRLRDRARTITPAQQISLEEEAD